jgi:hypothetical protein
LLHRELGGANERVRTVNIQIGKLVYFHAPLPAWCVLHSVGTNELSWRGIG